MKCSIVSVEYLFRKTRTELLCLARLNLPCLLVSWAVSSCRQFATGMRATRQIAIIRIDTVKVPSVRTWKAEPRIGGPSKRLQSPAIRSACQAVGLVT